MKRQALLEGIRITDLTTVFFGPYCTQTLADLGAEVVKLEPAEGDTSRIIGTPPATPGMGPVFMRLNRARAMLTSPDSMVVRSVSTTSRRNSGSSSKKSTPPCANVTSPG